MFIFLTCIRHPDSSNNYQLVSQLFENCARSVCNQTNNNFKLIVVCNVKPEIDFSDERIIYHIVDLPIPDSREGVLLDKGCKRIAGLILAKKLFPLSYTMMVDADDLVSNKLVENTIKAGKHRNGWWFDQGYLIDLGHMLLQRKHQLNNWCGSTLILNTELLYEFSQLSKSTLNESSSFQNILSQIDHFFLREVLGNHLHVRDYFNNKGKPLEKYNDFGCAWVVNTNENESKTRFSYSGVALNDTFYHEFGLIRRENAITTSSIPQKTLELIAYKLSALSSIKETFISKITNKPINRRPSFKS